MNENKDDTNKSMQDASKGIKNGIDGIKNKKGGKSAAGKAAQSVKTAIKALKTTFLAAVAPIMGIILLFILLFIVITSAILLLFSLANEENKKTTTSVTSNAAVTLIKVDDTEDTKYVWQRLIDAGYTEEAAAGIMGNLWAENHFSTTDEKGGYGIGQWTSGRRTQAMQYPQTLEGQVDFLLWELDNKSDNGQNWNDFKAITHEDSFSCDSSVCTNEYENAIYYCAAFDMIHFEGCAHCKDKEDFKWYQTNYGWWGSIDFKHFGVVDTGDAAIYANDLGHYPGQIVSDGSYMWIHWLEVRYPAALSYFNLYNTQGVMVGSAGDTEGLGNNDISGIELTGSESENLREICAYEGNEDLDYNGDGVINGKDVVLYGCSFIGNPYVWGGVSLTNGCDCSGFVGEVMAHFGLLNQKTADAHGYTTRNLINVGAAVKDEKHMKVGDIICYQGHVGIYAGNKQFVNALGSKYGIKLTSIHYKTIKAIRRLPK